MITIWGWPKVCPANIKANSVTKNSTSLVQTTIGLYAGAFCPYSHGSQMVRFKTPMRNFYFMLIVAARVDRSSTAYCRKYLVWSEHLFWRRVRESLCLFAQYQLSHKHKILKLPKEKHPPASNHRFKKREQRISNACKQQTVSPGLFAVNHF